MKPQAVAVLDVGKTNKKVSLYNRRFELMSEERTTLQPKDFNGMEVEDTGALLRWFRSALKKLAATAEVRAIAITTHGATLALLDDTGALAHPVISYSAPKGAEVQEDFYKTFGDRAALHHVTCTPDLGFANMAKALFYLKTRMPEVWNRRRYALFYPAYLAYELTGNMGIEPTYLGNHSYLWNFAERTWSVVGRALDADGLFPSTFANSWDGAGPVKPEIAQECGLPADCKVTLGIHDSNANFLPYLAKGYQDFLLNSTGTWCVLMRPATDTRLTPEEVAAKVLFNLDAFGRPVRTCIFPAGMEYDTFRGFTTLPDQSSLETVREVVAARRLFIVPGVLPDASAFPGATPRVVDGCKVHPLATLRAQGGTPMTELGQDYYAALNLSLALATRKMLTWCDLRPGTTIFIEGGFAKNQIYCQLLATLCPQQKFALTNVQEGTSFGAALTAWMLAETLTLQTIGQQFQIQTTPIPPQDFGDLQAYESAFSRQLNQ
jgi:sugar (pentulose or hexulose) kinase